MHIRTYTKHSLKPRLAILISTTIIFLISFGLNIAQSQALYHYNLNAIPQLQNNPVLGSHGFMVFMNVVSVVFDPMVCAGYIFVIYLITFRKLEIIAFLVWFGWLTWLLGIMKMAIHQARPFWLPGTQIKMQSWTCYTDYGNPSGHSMLAIVLLQFLLRFYARVHTSIHTHLPIFYILIFLLQLLVMFSRVMLGMHTLNQVLFGLSIGLYSFIWYYLFVEAWVMRGLVWVMGVKDRMGGDGGNGGVNGGIGKWGVVGVVVGGFLVVAVVGLLVAILPTYDNSEYIAVIDSTPGCKIHPSSSFQYACLFGTSILSIIPALLTSLTLTPTPQNLTKQPSYSRLSIKFISKLLLTLILGLIPILIFMNPLWGWIDTSVEGMAVIKWVCANCGFFFGVVGVVVGVGVVGGWLGLEVYVGVGSYEEFRKYQVGSLGNSGNDDLVIQKPRQTELTEPRITNYGTKLS